MHDVSNGCDGDRALLIFLWVTGVNNEGEERCRNMTELEEGVRIVLG